MGFPKYPGYPGYPRVWPPKYHRNGDDDRATWRDLSGEENDGTLTNFAFTEASGWASDPPRLVFGGNNDYVSLPNLGIGEDGSFTYEVWHRVGSVTATNRCLVSESQNLNNGDFYDINCYGTAIAGRMFAAGASVQVAVSSALVVGAQRHEVFTGDGTNLRFYHQNTAYGPVAMRPLPVTLDYTSLGFLRRNVSANHYAGDILAVRMYDRPLSAAEVAQNHAAGPTGWGYVRDGLVLDLNAARSKW